MIMNFANKTSLALLAGLSVAAFSSLAVAQDSATRDAAISKCVKQAQTQYPDDSITNQSARTAAYKACMAATGQNP
jgi:hypothetical protein